jgi:hypothetical protein
MTATARLFVGSAVAGQVVTAARDKVIAKSLVRGTIARNLNVLDMMHLGLSVDDNQYRLSTAFR